MFRGCIAPNGRRWRKTIFKYYPTEKEGWYAPDGEGTGGGFFRDHNHGGTWGNYIVFVPEVCGLASLEHIDEPGVAEVVIQALHGKLDPNDGGE
jgi:hypothetical protein